MRTPGLPLIQLITNYHIFSATSADTQLNVSKELIISRQTDKDVAYSRVGGESICSRTSTLQQHQSHYVNQLNSLGRYTSILCEN